MSKEKLSYAQQVCVKSAGKAMQRTGMVGPGGPAPSSSGSSGDVSSSAGPSQTDVLSPITTEAEVRALYGCLLYTSK